MDNSKVNIENKYFFIGFWYDHYCQGWENEYIERLVCAMSMTDAIYKIEQSTYTNPRNFKDLTIY